MIPPPYLSFSRVRFSFSLAALLIRILARDQLKLPRLFPLSARMKAEAAGADRMRKQRLCRIGRGGIISRCGQGGNAYIGNVIPIVIPAEEIAVTVIARYLSRSDTSNLSSTILVHVHRRVAACKMIHYDICVRYPSPRDLTLRGVFGTRELSMIYS